MEIWARSKDQWRMSLEAHGNPHLFYILEIRRRVFFASGGGEAEEAGCPESSFLRGNDTDEIQGISISAGFLGFSYTPIYPSRRKSKARSRPRSNSDHLLVSFFFFYLHFEKKNNTRVGKSWSENCARGEERRGIRIWTAWLHIHDTRALISPSRSFSFSIPLLLEKLCRNGTSWTIVSNRAFFNHRFAMNNFEKYLENIYFVFYY